MLMSRRGVLGLGSLLLTPAGMLSSASALASKSRLFLSAAADSAGLFWLYGFTLADASLPVEGSLHTENSSPAIGSIESLYKVPLPSRAHHIAIDEANGLYVVVARRPGKYLLLGDLYSGEILQQVTLPEGRHLLGHGIFSASGEDFFTVESDYNDTEGDSGRIVHWRISNDDSGVQLHRQNDFPSYGVGPHELLLLPDQSTLVVANGGIRTHPDSGREKLNLDTMQPSLVYIDVWSGALLKQDFLDESLHKASIRHLDVNDAGVVAIAMQYQGEAFEQVPLVATHSLAEGFALLEAPAEVQRQMQQYVGSIKFDHSGRFIAASCPRGNMITFWDAQENSFITSIRSRDGCGLSAADGGFVFTAGTGRISYYDLLTQDTRLYSAATTEKIFWDNHLS